MAARGILMARKNLMIVMAGDNSTHLPYCTPNREFDIWVNYFGNNKDISQKYAQNCDRFWHHKGMKVELLRKICVDELHSNGFDFSIYDYIFLMDDDIIFENGTDQINEMFQIAKSLNADSFQPAIKNDFYSHKATLVEDGNYAHCVNWVEMMMPAYTSKVFINGVLQAINFFCYLKSGWGIEAVSTRLGEFILGRGLNNIVLDCVPVIHSRPVGKNRKLKTAGQFEFFLTPMAKIIGRMKSEISFATQNDAIAYCQEKRPLTKISDEQLNDKTKSYRRKFGVFGIKL
jgi:hypothetical protein